MGLYKRCEHRGRERDRCDHAWWGIYKHKGIPYRVSLQKWTKTEKLSKTLAQEKYEEMRQAIRNGTFTPNGQQPTPTVPAPTQPSTPSTEPTPARMSNVITFRAFANEYIKKHIDRKGMKKQRGCVLMIAKHFGDIPVDQIKAADVEDWIDGLREPAILGWKQKAPRKRTAGTINRLLSRLRHMFNWGIGREYVERTPFRRGTAKLIVLEKEDNQRDIRLTQDEEQRLFNAAEDMPWFRDLMIGALDSGLRRGELVRLTVGDLKARQNAIRVQGMNAKSGKTRYVPISTDRLDEVLTRSSNLKALDTRVFTYEDGTSIIDFRKPWELVKAAAKVEGVRWHDLRHEYASRLLEQGATLGTVRDNLGHASIATTQRYLHTQFDQRQRESRHLNVVNRITKGSQPKPNAAA